MSAAFVSEGEERVAVCVRLHRPVENMGKPRPAYTHTWQQIVQKLILEVPTGFSLNTGVGMRMWTKQKLVHLCTVESKKEELMMNYSVVIWTEEGILKKCIIKY